MGKTLGYKLQKATETFARLNLDPGRVFMETVTRFMFERAEDKEDE